MQLGIRELEAIRNLPLRIEAMQNELNELHTDNKIMKDLLRSIKKAVVRKYGEAADEKVAENE